jgi:hypothetical protein
MTLEQAAKSSPLAYLFFASAANRITHHTRRWRRPRYFIAVVFGVGYFALILIRPGGHRMPSGAFASTGQATATLLLLIIMAKWWLFGSEQSALAFTPAEVDFLFAAPITRRRLIGWKLARTQVTLLFNALLWTLLLAGSQVSWPARFLGFWVLFATLHMHQLGASLVRTSTVEQGRAGIRRQAVSLAIAVAVVVALGISLANSAAELRSAAGPSETLGIIARSLHQPPARYALFPITAMLAPAVGTAGSWFVAFAIALTILLLHAVWVLSVDSAFEDAAISASARRARLLSAARERRSLTLAAAGGRKVKRTRIPLAPAGQPAVAIFWKNLVAMQRSLGGAGGGRILGALLVAVAIAAVSMEGQFAEMVGVLLGSWAGLSMFAGPLWVRTDFRQDMPLIDVLRSYPLRPMHLAAAEVGASALIVTLLQGILITGGLVVLVLSHSELPAFFQPRYLLAGALLVLPINVLLFGAHNGVALLFPDIGARGSAQAGGIENLGLQLLITIASLLFLVIALIVPFLAVVAGVFLTGGAPSLIVQITIFVAALGALVAEAVLILYWVGRVFEKGK